MSNSLRIKADEIIALLNKIPGVKKCRLYGSLASNTYDELSDIDIEIDVSGYDNGQFMLCLAGLIKDELSICYVDYAPSLIPDKYIVSLAIDKDNPFLILDLCCSAKPHITTVKREQVVEKNGHYTHMLKLWTTNLKHYVRGDECRDNIEKMAKKITIGDIKNKNVKEILSETLCWLEDNTEKEIIELVQSCRRKFDELVKRIIG